MLKEMIPYQNAVFAAVTVGLLFMLQTFVGFVARLRAGHEGGMPITPGHDRFLFRADRARSNTYEVIGAFALLLFSSTVLGASPPLVNIGAALFAGARLAHMACYYADLRRLRSLSFIAGNAGLILLLVSCIRAIVTS